MTPGTLSVDIGEDLRTLTIHSLHAPDPQRIIDSIRTRYEQPLARIFACSNVP
jgi:multicomponent K+:H+ antiporter subunit E